MDGYQPIQRPVEQQMALQQSQATTTGNDIRYKRRSLQAYLGLGLGLGCSLYFDIPVAIDADT